MAKGASQPTVGRDIPILPMERANAGISSIKTEESSVIPTRLRSQSHRPATSDPRQSLVSIAEMVELDPHPIHQGQVQATELAVAFALAGIVEDSAGFKGPAEAASSVACTC